MQNKGLQWATLLFLAFIWGSSFILMKRGLLTFTSTQVAAYRMVSSSLALMPFALYHIRKLPKNKVLFLIAIGLFGNMIPAYLFTLAQTNLSSSFTGMLNSLTPMFTLLVGMLFGARPRLINTIGIAIGMVGITGLILANSSLNLGAQPQYALLIVLATLCYGLSVNLIKHKVPEVNSLLISSFAFMFVGPPNLIYLFSTGFFNELTSPQAWSSLGYITILGVVGTAMALVIFNVLIKEVSALAASSVTYLIPVVAMMWGVVDGEPITLQHVLWMAVVLTGVYMINDKKAKPLPPTVSAKAE